MQKLDYSCMNWERIDPASLVGLSVTIADVTGVPGLCNGIVLTTLDAVRLGWMLAQKTERG